MTISMIAAVDRNFLIGTGGELPWGKLPADMSYFKRKTIAKAREPKKTIIMGRKTYESLPIKPLPQRVNIVVTNNRVFRAPDCIVLLSLYDALEFVLESPEAMVIGGASVYKFFAHFADRLYLTQIDGTFRGDVYFPITQAGIDMEWEEKESERIYWKRDRKNPHDLVFKVFERKRKQG